MAQSKTFSPLTVWFITGSQHLYGPEALKKVDEHARQVVAGLNKSSDLAIEIVWKPVLTTPESILETIRSANSDPDCVGLIAWMHTFSPAKMWIAGLGTLQKPLLHLHTQFHRDLPWSTIDMDFMNLNQSAHGGREFGHICARLRLARKVVVGHWQEKRVHQQIDVWARAAAGLHEARQLKIARFGDNMRHVAVTEGDKVSFQMKVGTSVNGFGIGDLAERIAAVPEPDAARLCEQYDDEYNLAKELQPNGARRSSLQDAARIEIALRGFLDEGGFRGFTDTFEDLHGLKQLPGLPVQRLMADGYGFGAEGDWKAAAMVRISKVMAQGWKNGTSFMEDYTYHLPEGNMQCLGAHMLEICPSLASDKPSCEIHPLGIGGKEDPVRLVFDTPVGPGVNATIVDLGGRFRLIINEVDVVEPAEPLAKLPVARAVWKPRPDLPTAAAAWIYAGGSHHPVFSQALTTDHYLDLAEMMGTEAVVIDADTRLRDLRQSLR